MRFKSKAVKLIGTVMMVVGNVRITNFINWVKSMQIDKQYSVFANYLYYNLQ